tara:strand:- start:1207 stop:2127 length:921 start_codon:yes stop_codon:yes gene_type:complete
MARQRLTQRGYNPKTASFRRHAHPDMLHPDERSGLKEPAGDAYVIGEPSDWMEDVQTEMDWKAEYAAGRNEVGMGNFLPESVGGSRQASFEDARKLATQAVRLASAIFPDADEDFIREQGRDFMAMGQSALDGTISRILSAAEKAEEEESEDDESEGKDKEASLQARIASLEGMMVKMFRRLASEDEEDEEDEEESEGKDKEASEDEDEEASEDEGKGKEASLEAQISRRASEASDLVIDFGEASASIDKSASSDDLLNEVFKTASRKRGVSKIAGVTPATKERDELAMLQSFWPTAPDVSGEFSS